MRGSKPTVIVGAIILGFGFLFHLQGQAVVGPESSFMYSNPQWTTYGLQILISGLIILVIGIGMFFIKKT